MQHIVPLGLFCALFFTLSTITMAQGKGRETGLPLPRYVSMKAAEGNVRRGPSLTHRVDWVYKHRNVPLRVVAEHGHWRRVVDIDGAGGWMHYALLSGTRTVIVAKDGLSAYASRALSAEVRMTLQKGVIARLGSCDAKWCLITADGYRGWVDKSALWGLLPDEIRD
ncbi:MAG: SH3 domain-containing protein [Pseudomonadota bacterium]